MKKLAIGMVLVAVCGMAQAETYYLKTNTGSRRGDEVVQMYIRDMIFSVARPLWELRGFKRVTLDPGESTTVSFELGEKELGFWNREGRFVVEPGDFKVAVWTGFSPGALARNAATYKIGK